MMLTGRTPLPPGFSGNSPTPADWPSIAAIAGAVTRRRGTTCRRPSCCPKNSSITRGRIIPGQFAGEMGPRRDPWFIEASPYSSLGYGAYPEYEFDHQERANMPRRAGFQAPNLTLPEGFGNSRLVNRLELLSAIDRQRADLDRFASIEQFDRYREGAISLLTDKRVREAVDVTAAAPEVQERYGKNSFGWSLLMARRLVEAGVNLVQVNLGNNETWDTHGEAFPHLKDQLFPPTDKALSALLDDLNDSGLLDSTLIVMAGEFGRTPKVTHLPQHYKLPGRDHWGAVQTVFFAGGGVRGGTVVGSSDKIWRVPGDGPADPREHGRHDLSFAGPARDRRVVRRNQSSASHLLRRTDRSWLIAIGCFGSTFRRRSSSRPQGNVTWGPKCALDADRPLSAAAHSMLTGRTDNQNVIRTGGVLATPV